MSGRNQTPAATDAAELDIEEPGSDWANSPGESTPKPAISRSLHPDPIDNGQGAPLVVCVDAFSGRIINIFCEADDDYEAELALAEQENREVRDSVRKAMVRSEYARELLEEAAAAAAASNQPKPASSRFTPRVPDLASPRPKWIVKGIVPDQSLVMIYGRHGTGKSTLAIEMGVDVALGKPWHGRKTKHGPVVYIASEDTHGFRARLDAVLRDRGITLDNLGGQFMEISGRPHLLKPNEVQELIKEIKPLNPAACFVDTMARAAAGADENSAQEMGVMIENCQTIINQTGATVVLLHHTGKDASKGARGSSAIPGAVDAEIFLERPDETENLRVARVGKMRGGPDYYTLFRYQLETVQLAVDEDGDKITSTVVREIAPDPVGVRPVAKLKNTPVRVAIRSVLGDAQRAMPFEELITAAKERLSPPDPGEEDRRRDRIKATFERMIADRELHMDANGMVSLLDPAMPFTPVQADDHADLIGGPT